MNDVTRADADVAPAHVAPVAGDGGRVHADEVRIGAASGPSRPEEGRAHLDTSRPRDAAVRRAIKPVHTRAVESATALVHGGEENVTIRIRRHLHVAAEGREDLDGSAPGHAPVGGEHGVEALTRGEVVPGHVDPAVEGTRRVVVDPHRLAIVRVADVRAVADRPGRAVVRRAPDAESLPAAARGTAAREEDGHPHRVHGVVDDRRVAGVRPPARRAAEGVRVRPCRAPVGRARAARDADRAREPARRVVVGGHDGVPVRPDLDLGLGDVREGLREARDQILVGPAVDVRRGRGELIERREARCSSPAHARRPRGSRRPGGSSASRGGNGRCSHNSPSLRSEPEPSCGSELEPRLPSSLGARLCLCSLRDRLCPSRPSSPWCRRARRPRPVPRLT